MRSVANYCALVVAVLICFLQEGLGADKPGGKSNHVAVELRAIGDCSDPDTSEPLRYKQSDKDAEEQICLKASILVDENDIADAGAMKGIGKPELLLRFNDKGAARLKKATLNMFGERLAFVVNGAIFAVATLRGSVSRDLVLTGGFEEGELQRLVDSIRAQTKTKKPTPGTSHVET